MVIMAKTPPFALVYAAEVKQHLRAIETKHHSLIQDGKAVAVLLAVTDEDELERLVLAHSPKFQALLDKSRRQIADTGGIPHEQFWNEVAAETRVGTRKGKHAQHR